MSGVQMQCVRLPGLTTEMVCSITYTFILPRNQRIRVCQSLAHSYANVARNWRLQIRADIRYDRLPIALGLNLLTCPRSSGGWNRLQVKKP